MKIETLFDQILKDISETDKDSPQAVHLVSLMEVLGEPQSLQSIVSAISFLDKTPFTRKKNYFFSEVFTLEEINKQNKKDGKSEVSEKSSELFSLPPSLVGRVSKKVKELSQNPSFKSGLAESKTYIDKLNTYKEMLAAAMNTKIVEYKMQQSSARDLEINIPVNGVKGLEEYISHLVAPNPNFTGMDLGRGVQLAGVDIANHESSEAKAKKVEDFAADETQRNVIKNLDQRIYAECMLITQDIFSLNGEPCSGSANSGQIIWKKDQSGEIYAEITTCISTMKNTATQQVMIFDNNKELLIPTELNYEDAPEGYIRIKSHDDEYVMIEDKSPQNIKLVKLTESLLAKYSGTASFQDRNELIPPITTTTATLRFVNNAPVLSSIKIISHSEQLIPTSSLNYTVDAIKQCQTFSNLKQTLSSNPEKYLYQTKDKDNQMENTKMKGARNNLDDVMLDAIQAELYQQIDGLKFSGENSTVKSLYSDKNLTDYEIKTQLYSVTNDKKVFVLDPKTKQLRQATEKDIEALQTHKFDELAPVAEISALMRINNSNPIKSSVNNFRIASFTPDVQLKDAIRIEIKSLSSSKQEAVVSNNNNTPSMKI